MNNRIWILVGLVSVINCTKVSAQCLNAFLDSINPKVMAMHDGRYHVSFNFSTKMPPSAISAEGTAYYSRDSVTIGSVGDFVMFGKDTIPVFGYLGEYFYRFDATKKEYTKQFLRRRNFYQKTTFDFQNFMAVSFLLNNSQFPFDDYLTSKGDSAFCGLNYAGYMQTDTLKSAQLGEQFRKRYCYVLRSKNGDTIEISNNDDFGGDKRSRVWVIDSMKVIKHGEQFVQKKIKQYTKAYKAVDAVDLDDKTLPETPPSVIPVQKVMLDTVPVNTVLKTLEYKPYSLDNAGGKLLLLDFWFANCRPCLEAMPHLESLYKKYHDKGLAVVGINPYDYDMDIVHGILTKAGVDYNVCLDSEAELVKALGIFSYPTMLLVDPKSKKIIFSYTGSDDFSSVEKNITTILNGK